MIRYDLKCSVGHRFEVALASMFSDNPPCECGAETSRIPARVNTSGMASAGPSRDDMPTTWRGTRGGDPDLIRHWHTQMTKREKLEEKYPELAGDRRPILAHEGAFAAAPLRAGDPLPTPAAPAASSSAPGTAAPRAPQN